MKRNWSLFYLILSMLLALSFILSACGDWSLNYSRITEYGGWEIALDPEGGNAFAASFRWDGSEEGKRIVVPDEVEGCPVFKLGGYYGRGLPMPFGIAMPYSTYGEADPQKRKDPEEETVFTLVIGKNLQEIQNVADFPDYIRVDEKTGEEKICRVAFRVEADEENPCFYVKENRLYRRSDGSLVAELPYEGDIAGIGEGEEDTEAAEIPEAAKDTEAEIPGTE